MGAGEGGDIIAKFSADAQAMLGEIGRVTGELKKMHKESAGGAKETAKETQNWMQQFRGVDSQLRMITHLGRGLLGVFGVGGGVAAGIAFIRRESERVQKNLEDMGQVQVKIGQATAGTAALGGAAGVTDVTAIAKRLGVEEDKVRPVYEGLLRQGLSPAAARSQTLRTMEEQAGGPGRKARTAEAAKVSPLIELAQIVETSQVQAKEAQARPATMIAARKHARAQMAAINKALQDQVAAELGYESAGKVPTFGGSLEETEQKYQRQRQALGDVRKKLGFEPTTFYFERDGRRAAEVLSPAEVEELAQRLLDAAEKQKQAATDQAGAAAAAATAARDPR